MCVTTGSSQSLKYMTLPPGSPPPPHSHLLGYFDLFLIQRVSWYPLRDTLSSIRQRPLSSFLDRDRLNPLARVKSVTWQVVRGLGRDKTHLQSGTYNTERVVDGIPITTKTVLVPGGKQSVIQQCIKKWNKNAWPEWGWNGNHVIELLNYVYYCYSSSAIVHQWSNE